MTAKFNILLLSLLAAAMSAGCEGGGNTNLGPVGPEQPDPSVYDKGVVIDGVKWATRNVGESGKFVAAPSDCGGFYTFEQAQEACPEGWRVPTKDEFVSLSATVGNWTVSGEIAGYMFGTAPDEIFMPGAGFLALDGETVLLPGEGYYWSSTPAGELMYFFYFKEDLLRPENQFTPDTAFSVRCVAEEVQ